MTPAAEKTFAVEGTGGPDSSLAREITELVRDTGSVLLFHHSSRVYDWVRLPESAARSSSIANFFMRGDVSRHEPDAHALQHP